MTAAVMMGYDMKGEDDLLTLKIQGDGPIGRTGRYRRFQRRGKRLCL